MHGSLPRYFGTSRGMVIWESSRTMICPPGERLFHLDSPRIMSCYSIGSRAT
ncbi:hypothetical protein MUK42_18592 [Musa troglodytarum]|uniref:Uncharacterized protein n=1 Tax=Musa troglodytarum TaxID=320322 RepID=A0A9E7EHD3_9LILI|nr:hypothetical protein MUK42_18592 [Musa troglodytarum]